MEISITQIPFQFLFSEIQLILSVVNIEGTNNHVYAVSSRDTLETRMGGREYQDMNHDKGPQRIRDVFFPSAEATILDIKRFCGDFWFSYSLLCCRFLRIERFLSWPRKLKDFDTSVVEEYWGEVIHLSSLLEESDMLEWLIMNSFTETGHILFISK